MFDDLKYFVDTNKFEQARVLFEAILAFKGSSLAFKGSSKDGS